MFKNVQKSSKKFEKVRKSFNPKFEKVEKSGKKFKKVQKCFKKFKHFWTFLNILEHFWTFLNIFEHFWTFLKSYCVELEPREGKARKESVRRRSAPRIFEHFWTFSNIFEHFRTFLNIYCTDALTALGRHLPNPLLLSPSHLSPPTNVLPPFHAFNIICLTSRPPALTSAGGVQACNGNYTEITLQLHCNCDTLHALHTEITL